MSLSPDPEKRAAQLANLRPFKPGENGRAHPPTPMVTPALRRMASMSVAMLREMDEAKLSAVEAMARARWLRSLLGDGWRDALAIEDKLDGKVVERHEVDLTEKVSTVVVEERKPLLRRVK